MSTEASSGSVVRRAALHAALGDPGRLTIVDTLAWGEASPGELAARLGMTSNLLAHHLRVLEEVGLVTRHRSEGDRRRSYVALAPRRPRPAAPDRGCPDGGAGGVRVHAQLGPLAAGRRDVERPQPGPGHLRGHPPRTAGASRRGRRRPPPTPLPGARTAPPRPRRPRPRRPGRHRLRQRPRRTRRRRPRAGGRRGRGCTGRSPTP